MERCPGFRYRCARKQGLELLVNKWYTTIVIRGKKNKRKSLAEKPGLPVFDPMPGSGGLLTNILLGRLIAVTEKKLFYDASGAPTVCETGKQYRFGEMSEAALLNSADIMAIFGISRTTFARYLSEHGLKPTLRCHRKLYFSKRDVERWLESMEKDKWPIQAMGRLNRTSASAPAKLLTLPFGSGKTAQLMTLLQAALLKIKSQENS